MKKRIKILSSIMAAALFSVPLFGGTGCGPAAGKEGVLSIAAFEGGNGREYAEALAQAFGKYHPEIEFDVSCDPTVPESAQTALEANSSSVDVYMVNGLNIGLLCENSDGALAPLNDVYGSLPKTDREEGSKTIEQLIRPDILSSMKYGGDREPYAGNYYALPTGSNPLGLVLNTTCLDSVLGVGNWEEPRTSNELLELCYKIQLADKTVKIDTEEYTVYPFIYAGNAVEYWRYMWYVWTAQYDGAEAFQEAQSCRIDGKYAQEAYFSAGKEKALEVLEALLTRANDYCHPDSMTNKHTASQKYFMQGRAAMMCVGDWIENETGTAYKPDLRLIKTPVLSDVADLIGLTGTAAEKDAALSDIVKKLDEGATSDARLTQENFKKLKEARSMAFTLANSQIAVIPANSVNMDMAKEFLRFMYSREGFEVFLRSTKGSRLPVEDYAIPADFESSMTVFGKSIKAIAESNPTYIFTSTSDPIRFRAGLGEFLSNEKPEIALGKKTNARTAAQYLETEKTLMASQWAAFMSQVS